MLRIIKLLSSMSGYLNGFSTQVFLSMFRLFEPLWKIPEGGEKKNLGWKFFWWMLGAPSFPFASSPEKKTSLTSSVPVLLCLFWTSTSLTILHDTVKTIRFIEPLNVHFLSCSEPGYKYIPILLCDTTFFSWYLFISFEIGRKLSAL